MSKTFSCEHCLTLLVVITLSIKAIHTSGSIHTGRRNKLGFLGGPQKQIESLQFPPSAQDFYKNFVRQSKPVLLRNGASNWPAMHRWSNTTHLNHLYGQESFTVELRKKFKKTFPVRKTMRLAQFLDEFQDRDLYLESIFQKGSEMLKDAYLPLPLHCSSLYTTIDNLNLLISSGNTSSAFHQDGYENLLTVISGIKEVVLYDSRFTRDFNADQYSIATGVSDVDPENVDLEEYGALARLPCYSVTLHPGDMLYIPMYWWHQVRSYHNPNIAVGMWFTVFNFDAELERLQIDDGKQVVDTTEIFLELVDKEPLEINCQEKVNKTYFYSHSIFGERKDVCSTEN